MASRPPRKKRTSDDELVKALLATTSVGEAALRVGMQQRSLQRRLRSPQLRARLDGMRRELEIEAREAVVEPEDGRPLEAQWKRQVERYGQGVQGTKAVVAPLRPKTREDVGRRWFLAIVGFTVRLLWAAFLLLFLLAAVSLLVLLVLFIRFATGP